MQAKLIDLSLLSAAEFDWLNDYHSQVWEKVGRDQETTLFTIFSILDIITNLKVSQVSPLVDGCAREWLWNNTRPLVKL